MKYNAKFFFGIAFCLPLAGWGANCVYRKISFDRECGGHLVRASNANTVPMAEVELGRALGYLKSRGATSGYTSIVYTTPDEDVGFWYGNLEEARKELLVLVVKANNNELSSMEQSNVLLKLRDTLTDGRDGHERLTYPPGLAFFPNNFSNVLLGVIAGIVLLFGLFLLVDSQDRG